MTADSLDPRSNPLEGEFLVPHKSFTEEKDDYHDGQGKDKSSESGAEERLGFYSEERAHVEAAEPPLRECDVQKGCDA